jgi:phage FluMu gp28-like protein
MAYELIPMWLKPGVKEWNKRTAKFSNDSTISSAPTTPAVRGKTGNVLILDETAHIDSNIEKDFWDAVYPTISSSTKTKVIMVSTPNGTDNLFYRTF